MKKTFGWLFIIAGSVNLIISFIMMANGVMGEGSQNPITKLMFAIGFIIIGAYMIGAFKEESSRQEYTKTISNETSQTKSDTSAFVRNKTNNLPNHKATIDLLEYRLDKPIKVEPVEENKAIDIGEQMRINLVQKLIEQYEFKFEESLDNSYLQNLAVFVSKISKSYSDTSISIMNIKNALQSNQDTGVISQELISISNNYSINTMRSLNSIGLILGKQTIEIPHFSANQSNIPLEMIYQQGYELIGLAQQAGIEKDVIEILSAE